MGVHVFHFYTRELMTGCGPDTSEADLHTQLVRADGAYQLRGDGGRAVRPDSNRTAEGNYWWLPVGELPEPQAGMPACKCIASSIDTPPALSLLVQGWSVMGEGAVRPPETQPSLVRVLCLQPWRHLSMLETAHLIV